MASVYVSILSASAKEYGNEREQDFVASAFFVVLASHKKGDKLPHYPYSVLRERATRDQMPRLSRLVYCDISRKLSHKEGQHSSGNRVYKNVSFAWLES